MLGGEYNAHMKQRLLISSGLASAQNTYHEELPG